MKRAATTFALTIALLIALDSIVAIVLSQAEAHRKIDSLVRYFEYGRSVPGKLDRWQNDPELPGNLFDIAWLSEMIAESAARHASEPPVPTIRSYGMSFVDNILEPAAERLDMPWDRHSGPGAPPNYTYALFREDRANRREGDIVVLGILSSSVPAMAALSNRSWAFEQPAPFTYPVFWPDDGGGLRRIEPLIDSAAAERALKDGGDKARAWNAQMAEIDAFYSLLSFGAPSMDRSPFVRLVRRSLATGHIGKTKAAILAHDTYPYAEVLRRMIVDFAATARADGQTPIVFLIQSRDGGDADLLEIAKPVLDAAEIPYLATEELADLSNAAIFRPDGHYVPDIDAMFAERFLEIVAR
jgi:hypothetical protein